MTESENENDHFDLDHFDHIFGSIVHVDEEDKTSYLIQVSGSNYKANTLFVNESIPYTLTLS